MKRVLIFTASTGGGHNEAASSLQELFLINGYEVVKLDAFKETNKVLNSLITEGYEILIRSFSSVYRELYRLTYKEKVNSKVVGIITQVVVKKMIKLIKKHEPDLIITTHPFMVNVIGELKRTKKINVPFISIVTDYIAHQSYINDYVDSYITGSYYTKQSIIKRGIPKEKIHHYGIPIRKDFFVSSCNSSIKRHKEFTILLMGGSIGITNMENVMRNLIRCENKIKIIAVCGKNENLKKRIENEYLAESKNKKVIVFGFTKNVPELMDISDVIVTKPGGLTVSESIVKNLPIIIPYVYPGQEEENADFLVQSGAAIKIDDMKSIKGIIDDFVENPQTIIKMKRNLKILSNTYSLESIVQLAEILITQNKSNEEVKGNALLLTASCCN